MGGISHSATRSIRQLVIRLPLHLSSTFIRLWGWVVVIVKYYRKNPSFALSDCLLWGQYLFESPYHHSRKFNPRNLYGETPLATLEKIVKKSRLLSKDVVYEIGCGTGRTALWLHHFVKCRVVGIEHVPLFVERADRVKRLRHLDRVTFLKEDVLKSSFAQATWIYFYGTARETSFIHALTDRFATLSPKVKIITTSYPLSEYDVRFKGTFLCRASFPWGWADVYLNQLAVEL